MCVVIEAAACEVASDCSGSVYMVAQAYMLKCVCTVGTTFWGRSRIFNTGITVVCLHVAYIGAHMCLLHHGVGVRNTNARSSSKTRLWLQSKAAHVTVRSPLGSCHHGIWLCSLSSDVALATRQHLTKRMTVGTHWNLQPVDPPRE